jgi:hypothetical protein
MLRAIVVFVLVLAVAVVLGSTAHSLFVMDAWANAAAQGTNDAPPAISMAERMEWITHDIVGMAPLYATLVGVALLVAFSAAGFVARMTGLRAIVFVVAGAVAMLVLFMTVKAMLGTVGVFGARGTMGLAAQSAVGALAGLLFATFKPAAE